MIHGLLLDFDGTMCDSVPGLKAYYREFMADHGAVATDEDFDRLNGRPIADCMHDLVTRGQLQGDSQELTRSYLTGLEALLPTLPAMSGLLELLRHSQGHGIKVAVVSSGHALHIRQWLDVRGLSEYVHLVIGSESVTSGKPDAEPYRLAAGLLGLHPAECLAVEDSESGAKSAVAAGVPTLVLSNDTWAGTYRASDLQEVLTILSSGFSGVSRIMEIPKLRLVDAPAFSVAQHEEVDRVWEESLAVNNSLFDGPMTFVRRLTDAGIEVFSGTYRFWYVQYLGKVDLGVSALAVSGVIRVGERLLVCKRGAGVSQHPKQWELAPSGGVVLPSEENHKDALLTQLHAEAREELNLSESDLDAPTALAIVADHKSCVIDVVIEMRCALSAVEFEERWAARASHEYVDFDIIEPIDAVKHELVESSSLIVADLLSRESS